MMVVHVAALIVPKKVLKATKCYHFTREAIGRPMPNGVSLTCNSSLFRGWPQCDSASWYILLQNIRTCHKAISSPSRCGCASCANPASKYRPTNSRTGRTCIKILLYILYFVNNFLLSKSKTV